MIFLFDSFFFVISFFLCECFTLICFYFNKKKKNFLKYLIEKNKKVNDHFRI